MRSLLFFVAASVVWLLLACKKHDAHESLPVLKPAPARPYPGPPTSLLLQVRVTAAGLSVVGAAPRRDDGLPFQLEDHMDRVRDGDEALFEYRVLTPAGNAVTEGRFTVPLRGTAAYQAPSAPDRIAHQTTQPVEIVAPVAIPHTPEMAAIEFTRVLPSPGSLESWRRAPAGRFQLPASTVDGGAPAEKIR